MAGLGGSLPAYMQSMQEPEEDHENDEHHQDHNYDQELMAHVIDGYPYKDEEEFKADLDKLWFDKIEHLLNDQEHPS